LEVPIVEGMRRLLQSAKRPRSLLVEVQPGNLDRQTALMQSCGYRLVEKHQLTAGVCGAFNAVFEPGA
jgi:hypothetical protein